MASVEIALAITTVKAISADLSCNRARRSRWPASPTRHRQHSLPRPTRRHLRIGRASGASRRLKLSVTAWHRHPEGRAEAECGDIRKGDSEPEQGNRITQKRLHRIGDAGLEGGLLREREKQDADDQRDHHIRQCTRPRWRISARARQKPQPAPLHHTGGRPGAMLRALSSVERDASVPMVPAVTRSDRAWS